MPTPLIGRRAELERLSASLREPGACVAVVGAVGVGKTRLLEAWAEQLEVDPNAATLHILELETAPSHEALLRGLAGALEVPVHDRVEDALRVALAEPLDRVIALEHAERLSAKSERWIDDRATDAPSVRWLLLTRREMRGATETLRLSPLSLPDDESDGEAYQLFVQRARGLLVHDEPEGPDRGVIREIVAKLDGLPLAIVLAAPRLRLMSTATLLETLSETESGLWSVLDGASEGDGPRAALDAIWEELSEAERELLRQLSVFRSSFDLADVEAVVQLSDSTPLLTLLTTLSERCLVTQLPATDELRILRPVASHAATRLPPDQARRLRARYARHLAATAARVVAGEPTVRQIHWLKQRADPLERLLQDEEHSALHPTAWIAFDESLRRLGHGRRRLDALERVEKTGLLEAASKSAWWRYWLRRAEAHFHLDEHEAADEALSRALRASPPDERTRASAECKTLRAALLHARSQFNEARTAAEEAVLYARETGDPRLTARAYQELTRYDTVVHRPARRLEHARIILQLYESVDDRAGVALAHRRLSGALIALGRPREALEAIERSLAELRRIGDERELAPTLVNLAAVHQMLGSPNNEDLYLQGRRALRRFGTARVRCVHETNYVNHLVDLRRFSEARARLPEVYALARALGDPAWTTALSTLEVWMALFEGDDDTAIALTAERLDEVRASQARRSVIRYLFVAALSRAPHAGSAARDLLAEARLVLPASSTQFRVTERLIDAYIDLHDALLETGSTGAPPARVESAARACLAARDALDRAEGWRSVDARSYVALVTSRMEAMAVGG